MRGAWIEILSVGSGLASTPGRAPMRGAWIEMSAMRRVIVSVSVAPPCGARGLKSRVRSLITCKPCRAPRGRVD